MTGKGTSTIHRPHTPPRASDRGRSRLGDITRPVRIDRRITKRRRSTFMFALLALAIAGALAAALFVLPVRTYFRQDDQTAELDDELAQIQAVNDDLRSEVARLETDDGIREAAREQLGFMEEGERRESMLDLPAVPTDLPDGWPYSLVTGIVDLRTNPPVAASMAPTDTTATDAATDPTAVSPAADGADATDAADGDAAATAGSAAGNSAATTAP